MLEINTQPGMTNLSLVPEIAKYKKISFINLVKKTEEFPNKTIVANRHRRLENVIYKLMYSIHKIITLIFTGKLIKFGNFVCLPKNHIFKLLQNKNLWNSFSATVAKIIDDKIYINTDRGKRYFG